MTQLLCVGSINGPTYKYENVKKKEKRNPSIFEVEQICVPINVNRTHWACLVVNMPSKEIIYYDSLQGDGIFYTKAMLRFLNDEWHAEKGGTSMQDIDEWNIMNSPLETPQQHNGYDCGVFTCAFADFLTNKSPLTFTQNQIDTFRERLVISLWKDGGLNIVAVEKEIATGIKEDEVIEVLRPLYTSEEVNTMDLTSLHTLVAKHGMNPGRKKSVTLKKMLLNQLENKK